MSRRPSLLDQLHGLSKMGRGEATELSNQLEKEGDQATGFRSLDRSHEPSTSIHQEEDLKLYLDFIKFVLRKPRDTSDEVMKAEAFPEDFKELSTYLRKFIIFAFKYTDPRPQATGEAIQYRDSMLFWAKRIFNERDHMPPPRRELLDAMNQALSYMKHRYGEDNNPKPSEPTKAVGVEFVDDLSDVSNAGDNPAAPPFEDKGSKRS